MLYAPPYRWLRGSYRFYRVRLNRAKSTYPFAAAGRNRTCDCSLTCNLAVSALTKHFFNAAVLPLDYRRIEGPGGGTRTHDHGFNRPRNLAVSVFILGAFFVLYRLSYPWHGWEDRTRTCDTQFPFYCCCQRRLLGTFFLLLYRLSYFPVSMIYTGQDQRN